MKIWRAIFYLLVICLVSVHFLLITISIFPRNALRAASNLPDKYVARFWGQRWNLFAPDPLRADFDVFIKCLDDSQENASEQYEITRNLSSKGPDSFVHSYLDDMITEYINSVADMQSNNEQCKEKNVENTEYCSELSDFYRNIVDEKKEVIVNLASAFCDDLSNTSLRFNRANVKILSYPVVHWSKRHSGEKPVPGVVANFPNLVLMPGRGVGTWRVQ